MNNNSMSSSEVDSLMSGLPNSQAMSNNLQSAASSVNSQISGATSGDQLTNLPAYQAIMNQINKMLDFYNQNGQPIDHGIGDLEQFRKSWFYNDWLWRFRRLMSFTPLGTRGVIAIPNTTFEEWLYWFYQWAQAFEDDYNAFKKLVLEAIQVIEKHLELIDKEIDDIQKHLKVIDQEITNINNEITNINNEIKKLQDQVKQAESDANDAKNIASQAQQTANSANSNSQDALNQLKNVAVVKYWGDKVQNVNTEWLQYNATNEGAHAGQFWIQPRVIQFINGMAIAGFDIHNYLLKTKSIDETSPVVLFTIDDPDNTFTNIITKTPRFYGPHLVWYGSHTNPSDHNFYYGGSITDTKPFSDNSLWF